MVKKVRDEEQIKDLFVDYLRDVFNKDYVTTGEEIQATSGLKNFDYLLESNSGETMALEMTSVTKSSIPLIDRPSKIKIFEDFFNDLLNNGKGLPSIIFTILEAQKITQTGVISITKNKVKSCLEKKSQSLKNEIVSEIKKLPLYEKHNIFVDEGISFSIERGVGIDRLHFNLYSTHTSIIEFDDDRYQNSEEFAVYEQLKSLIPDKNASLDYVADTRVLLISDARESFGTSKVLRYAMLKYIEEFPSELTNVDEIFVCNWDYEEKRAVFEKISPL